VAQAAEKREMTGRPNNEILIASFRAVELLLLMLLLDRFEIFLKKFESFLHFLYTGRLMLVLFKTTVCHQLLTLADKYGVETLKKLCQIDLEKLTTETFPEHFMSTGPSATGMMMKPSEFDLRPT
jgi:hypothetical protein